MVKVVVLFKRKDGLSREEFIDYYENQHVKLFADKIPGSGIVRVVRRYFTPISAAFSGSDVPSEFDGILEIWFEDEKSFDGWFNGPRDAEFERIIMEDEAKLFDKSKAFFNTVEEFETEI